MRASSSAQVCLGQERPFELQGRGCFYAVPSEVHGDRIRRGGKLHPRPRDLHMAQIRWQGPRIFRDMHPFGMWCQRSDREGGSACESLKARAEIHSPGQCLHLESLWYLLSAGRCCRQSRISCPALQIELTNTARRAGKRWPCSGSPVNPAEATFVGQVAGDYCPDKQGKGITMCWQVHDKPCTVQRHNHTSQDSDASAHIWPRQLFHMNGYSLPVGSVMR